MSTSVELVNELDPEWILLISWARELGITVEEIHAFLAEASRST